MFSTENHREIYNKIKNHTEGILDLVISEKDNLINEGTKPYIINNFVDFLQKYLIECRANLIDYEQFGKKSHEKSANIDEHHKFNTVLSGTQTKFQYEMLPECIKFGKEIQFLYPDLFDRFIKSLCSETSTEVIIKKLAPQVFDLSKPKVDIISKDELSEVDPAFKNKVHLFYTSLVNIEQNNLHIYEIFDKDKGDLNFILEYVYSNRFRLDLNANEIKNIQSIYQTIKTLFLNKESASDDDKKLLFSNMHNLKLILDKIVPYKDFYQSLDPINNPEIQRVTPTDLKCSLPSKSFYLLKIIETNHSISEHLMIIKDLVYCDNIHNDYAGFLPHLELIVKQNKSYIEGLDLIKFNEFYNQKEFDKIKESIDNRFLSLYEFTNCDNMVSDKINRSNLIKKESVIT